MAMQGKRGIIAVNQHGIRDSSKRPLFESFTSSPRSEGASTDLPSLKAAIQLIPLGLAFIQQTKPTESAFGRVEVNSPCAIAVVKEVVHCVRRTT